MMPVHPVRTGGLSVIMITLGTSSAIWTAAPALLPVNSTFELLVLGFML